MRNRPARRPFPSPALLCAALLLAPLLGAGPAAAVVIVSPGLPSNFFQRIGSPFTNPGACQFEASGSGPGTTQAPGISVTTSAGSAGTGPSAQATNGAGASCTTTAAIDIAFDLFALHPDAPLDVEIPVLVSGTFSTAGGAVFTDDLELDLDSLGASSGVIQVRAGGAPLIRVRASGDNGLIVGSVSNVQISIDPTFEVDFFGTQLPATDLYRLGIGENLGFLAPDQAGTPPVVGCLPDPRVADDFGVFDLADGTAVACTGLDPSGFFAAADDLAAVVESGARIETDVTGFGVFGQGTELTNRGTIETTGNAPAVSIDAGAAAAGSVTNLGTIRTSGIAAAGVDVIGSDVEFENAAGALVETSGESSGAVDLNGDGSRARNEGTVRTRGVGSDAFALFGDGTRLENAGTIESLNDEADAVFVEGSDQVVVVNEAGATIRSYGDESDAIGGAGDEITVTNAGTVSTNGFFSAGIGIAGDDADLTNDGDIATQGVLSPGMGALGDRATVVNGENGSVATSGRDAPGIGAIGNARRIQNAGEITTSGANSPAMELQNGTGAEKPALENTGVIESTGARSAGMRATADRVELANTGEIAAGLVLPLRANTHGMEHRGSAGELSNEGTITVNSRNGAGMISVGTVPSGRNTEIVNRGTVDANGPDTSGLRASLPELTAAEGFLRHLIRNDVGATLRTNGDRSRGVDFEAGDLDVENLGTIAVVGNDARGIAGTFAGSEDVRLSHRVSNQRSISATQGARVRGIDVVGNDVTLENGEASLDGASLSVVGANAVGIAVAGDRAVATNRGRIDVDGTEAQGVLLVGDDAVFENAIGSEGAVEIRVDGSESAGVRTQGRRVSLENFAKIEVSGADAFAVDAVLTGPSVGDVVRNHGDVSTTGLRTQGMSLAALDPLLPDPSPPLPTGGVPLVHQLLNEGTLAVDGADGVGMSLASLESAFLQNARAVDVDGDRGVGLRTLLVSKSVVANLGLVEVDGADAVGIDFDGESSTLIHGNGSSGSVAIPSLDPTTGSPRIDPNGVDPVFLPNAFSLQVEFDDEDGTFFPIGETRVTGFSPVGIRIEGRNNQVAIAKSAASIVGGDNVSSTVSAAGPGGIGVEILGSGTVLLNDGVIHGTDAAIVGSDGRDVVVNNNELTQQNPASGATVRLGGGDDFFQTNSTDLIVGLVDGGDGTDALRLFAGDSPLPQQFDLDTFVNFESLVKIGRGTMTAAGTLDLPTLVLQGTLDLAESTVLGDLQTGGEGAAAGRVTGNPRIEGTLDQRGGEVAPGNSPGVIQARRYRMEAGTLAIEIAGTAPEEHDRLIVDETAEFLGGVISVSFLDDFGFELGQGIDFLTANEITGFENLALEVSGLDPALALELRLDGGALGVVAVAASVPEAGTLLLLVAAATGLALPRRAGARPKRQADERRPGLHRAGA